MRAAIAVTGGPENHLFAAASAAMGRFYRLPSSSWVSTEAMCPGAQSAIEKSIGFLTHAESGISLIWGIGQLESEMTLSPAQAVLDDEMLAYIERYRRGIDVTEETLAIDVVRRAGIGGNFLEDPHTLAHYRDELYEPAILCRTRRELWERAGAKRVEETAEEKADALIEAERLPLLAPDESKALREIERKFLSGL
jgi:trimethylamine--corrinoid protein Co-methyltransferase